MNYWAPTFLGGIRIITKKRYPKIFRFKSITIALLFMIRKKVKIW